jgi:hypothetical protein
MLNRTRWSRLLPYLAGGVVVYVAGVALSSIATTGGWSGLDAWIGALALGTAAEALIAWVCLGLQVSRLGRGVAQTVIGAAACAVPLIRVPAAGYHGRALFFAGSVAVAGLVLGLQGVVLTLSGWRAHPAPVGESEPQAAGAGSEPQAADAETEPGGAAAGPHDLDVAARPARITLAAIFSLLAAAGLALLGLAVLVGLSATPDDPQPVGPLVVQGVCGAVLLLVGALGAVGFARLRGWLQGSTLNVLRPAGHRSADLAAVQSAELVSRNAVPVLVLSGQGDLRRFPLRQWGTSKLLPPAALAGLADALAANPRGAELAATVDGLRELAQASTGHQPAAPSHP